MQWNFYFSGILYGRLYQEGDALLLERLDISEARFGERRPYGEEDDLFFASLCQRSLRAFFEKRMEYERKAAGRPPEFVTADGERFTRRHRREYFQRHKKYPLDLLFGEETVDAVLMSGRDFCAVLVKDGREDQTPLAGFEKLFSSPAAEEAPCVSPFGPVYPVQFEGTFFVETRDKERLATDVYLPGRGKRERVPAVLVRTPYGKGHGAAVYYRFVQRGYAVVIQDTRGREDSTGEWLPEYYEVEDGDDTLNWIAAQPWSDGQAAMTGGSYLGYVQWAAAASGNPHLKAMLSSVCAGSAFADIPRRGGCFISGMLAWAFAMSEQRMRPELMVREDWDEVLRIRPLATLAEQALGHPVAFLSKWLEHPDMDAFWKRSSWKERYQGPPVPALILSGWFDDNGMGTTEALELATRWPRGTWKAVLGPWKHSGNADYDLGSLFMGEDALRYDIDQLCFKWLEHFLRGAENGVEQTAAVEYYTLGENRWKEASAWPPAQTEERTFYLDADGENPCAGTGVACGAGRLTLKAPAHAAQDVYVYDPANPSVHRIDLSENELETPEDYTEEETRGDLLSYSTPVLERPFTVTGDARVRLFVSCGCPDTDFVVRLTDVDADGRSVKLADGVLDAKYRNGFERPEYMEPGEIYELSVRTTKLSHTFLPGHRMRLTVTSSAQNFIFPNSNTREGFNGAVRQKASVTLHRGGAHASSVTIRSEGSTDPTGWFA